MIHSSGAAQNVSWILAWNELTQNSVRTQPSSASSSNRTRPYAFSTPNWVDLRCKLPHEAALGLEGASLIAVRPSSDWLAADCFFTPAACCQFLRIADSSALHQRVDPSLTIICQPK